MIHQSRGPQDPTEAAIYQRIERFQPEIAETRLLNGARFIAASVADTPRVSVAIHFDAGSRREQEGGHGTLHFFEHLPAAAFRIASGGEDLMHFCASRRWEPKIQTSTDALTFGFICPDFDAVEAMTLVREMLSYDQDLLRQVFPIEKGRIINEIAQNEADQNRVVYSFVSSVVMNQTGYAHPTPGTSTEVSQYSFEQIMRFKERFLSTENATVAVSGPAEIVASAQGFFGGLHFPGIGGAQAALDLSGRPDWLSIPEVTKKSSPLFNGLEVVTLLPGLNGFNPREQIALDLVLNELSLVLNNRLSHQAGLTYNLMFGRYAFADIGPIGGNFNVAPERIGEARDLMAQTIIQFPDTVSESMLRDGYIQARNSSYLKSGPKEYFDALHWLAAVAERPYVSPIEHLNILASFTVEEIREVARKCLDLSEMKFVYFGTDEALSKA